MIHHSCDMCKQPIDAREDLRYVVKIEVFAALDQDVEPAGDDRDNLQEMQEILQRLEDHADEAIGDEVYQTLRYDLCPACRARFVKNPLGRESKHFKFSKN
ncbi:MAG: hypothetical protein QM811_01005 [Pirellulales bacterium]